MNNLQDLIERIVEAKVKTLLNESRRTHKKIKNQAIKNIGFEIAAKSPPRGGHISDKTALLTGRANTKYRTERPKPPKSFPDEKAVKKSKEAETGRYSEPMLGKVWARGDLANKARGKLGLKTVHGPKGKLP